MGQIKVFGLAQELNKYKTKMSEVIHSCIVDALKFPADKKFQRFFPLDSDNFYFPNGRTEKYTIVELSIFEGRSIEAKKEFIKLMYERFREQLNILENDIEITIFETPKFNWGIRGLPGDELALNYKVNV
ncbi:MAG: tautomerase family protein [Raineya sp.]|jgi:phenylpyruvate tautomerase PptA (4-oxalocrotonate tautomerase family)|nr:tautomerase family protein [Raineya sp.]